MWKSSTVCPTLCSKHERRGKLRQIRDQLAENNPDVFTRSPVGPRRFVRGCFIPVCLLVHAEALLEETDGANMNSILPPKIWTYSFQNVSAHWHGRKRDLSSYLNMEGGHILSGETVRLDTLENMVVLVILVSTLPPFSDTAYFSDCFLVTNDLDYCGH